jgi:hypothetical protein
MKNDTIADDEIDDGHPIAGANVHGAHGWCLVVGGRTLQKKGESEDDPG